MRLLGRAEIERFYRASLACSGYRSLDERARRVWMQAVAAGLAALPPGFVASLLERLAHRPMGERCGSPDPLEERLLTRIADCEPFRNLEGEFVLRARTFPEEQAVAVVERIGARLGRFYHPDVFMAAEDLLGLAPDLEPASPKSPGSAEDELLQSLYGDALSRLHESGASLDETDLFEIRHPSLFDRPGSRQLHRRLDRAHRSIRQWTRGDLTLPSESDSVVSRYGEPEALPMGGFDSFTRRGSLSALVPSELALAEAGEQIDLFDVRFLENELLYFQREEGLVFRIRRHIALVLELTPGMEQLRYQAWLLGFCAVFAERIHRVFQKDALRLHFVFRGHLPTELTSALGFFEHLLAEASWRDGVSMQVGAAAPEWEEGFQPITVGARPEAGESCRVPFTFTRLDDLSGLPEAEVARLLAESIDRVAEELVHAARS
ncbi:MAG: hypothetical protein QNK04_26525 [Myxococcota bacterium]|nr:hypothetical protein [Myxococcota bacterium]